MMLMNISGSKGEKKIPYMEVPMTNVVVTSMRPTSPLQPLRVVTGRLAGGLSGLTGLDPGVSIGLVVLGLLGLGALGVSRVMRRR